MIAMGYVVKHHRGRAKKEEIVDIAGKLAKGILTKLKPNQKVYFRPEYCDKCRRDTGPPLGGMAMRMKIRCGECWRKREREMKDEKPAKKPDYSLVRSEEKDEEFVERRKSETENKYPAAASPSAEAQNASTLDGEQAPPEVDQPDVDQPEVDQPEVALPEPDLGSSTRSEGATGYTLETSEIICRFESCAERECVVNPRDKFYEEAFCRDKCHVIFHRSCWNSFKGPVSTKNLVTPGDAACMTPDCPANIVVVMTKDFEGNIKTQVTVDDDENGKKKRWTTNVKTEEKAGKGKHVKEKKAGKKMIMTPHQGSPEVPENDGTIKEQSPVDDKHRAASPLNHHYQQNQFKIKAVTLK